MPLRAQRFFAEAADRYRELHERGVRDPALYLNLGNAAYLADRWPDALWAYQLGLKLDPNDAELRTQRDFVRARVIYPPSGHGHPEGDVWPAWLYRPAPVILARCAGIFYVLTCGLAMAAFLMRSLRLFLPASLTLLVSLAAGGAYWLGSMEAQADRDTPLVIIRENTTLYRGNGRNYPAHAEFPLLPRGLEARQLYRRGAWLQIRLSTGEVGWVPESQVSVVGMLDLFSARSITRERMCCCGR